MKRNLLLLMIIPTFCLLSSCSLNANYDENFNDGTFYNSSDLEDDESSSNQNNSDGNTFYVSSIPQEFHFNDKCYVYQQGIEINENNIVGLFGYFINREDLEKWMEIDQKNDIVYVIDENNSIYHYDLSETLTNRFELFLTTNTDEIALKAHGHYRLYKIIEI